MPSRLRRWFSSFVIYDSSRIGAFAEPLRRLTAALFVLLMIAAPAWAQQIDVIEPTGRLVTDMAGMLTPQEQANLEARLVAYDDSTSTQIAVVLLPNLGGHEPMDYAIALGRAWGVGQKGNDNGVVLLVSRDERTITIATGYGMEGAIPDAVADRIRRNVITPLFREGRFYDGISAGVDAIMAAAAGEFTAADGPPGEDHSSRGIPLGLLFVIAIIIFVVVTSWGDRDGGGKGGRGSRRYKSRFGGPPIIIWGGGWGSHGGGGFGGFGGGGGFGGFGGGGGFGGFGGGSFGGGGASGSW